MEAEVVISGNVGAAVEWREDERYDGRATFNLACTPSIRRGNEWVDLPTTWYRVTCWRKLAVNVQASVAKGDAVIVAGKLRMDRWLDERGAQRESYNIEATWVAHDLRRGTTAFERMRLRPDHEAPMESDHEAERLDALDMRELEALVLAAEGDGDPFAVDPGEEAAVRS